MSVSNAVSAAFCLRLCVRACVERLLIVNAQVCFGWPVWISAAAIHRGNEFV